MLDTIIIGAGPIGIYSAFYLKQKGVSVLGLEANVLPGGQLSSIYPGKIINNLPGIKAIRAQQYIDALLAQLDDQDIFLYQKQVIDIKKENNVFYITCQDQSQYQAKSVILATGNGELQPRLLGIKQEAEVNNLIYKIDTLQDFKNKEIVIFGGGDSAIDWALHLLNVTDKISIVHRRQEFRAHLHNVELLKKAHVNFYTPYQLDSCNIQNNHIIDLKIKNDTNIKTLSCDYVLCSYGFIASKNHYDKWGINNDNKKVIVDRKHQSNIKGLYAIGDSCIYENKNYNILTGLGEASVVANNIVNYLNALEGDKHDSRRTNKNY